MKHTILDLVRLVSFIVPPRYQLEIDFNTLFLLLRWLRGCKRYDNAKPEPEPSNLASCLLRTARLHHITFAKGELLWLSLLRVHRQGACYRVRTWDGAKCTLQSLNEASTPRCESVWISKQGLIEATAVKSSSGLRELANTDICKSQEMRFVKYDNPFESQSGPIQRANIFIGKRLRYLFLLLDGPTNLGDLSKQ